MLCHADNAHAVPDLEGLGLQCSIKEMRVTQMLIIIVGQDKPQRVPTLTAKLLN